VKPDTAIVLLNLGGPLRSRDVEGFLYRLFSDADVVQFPGPAFLQPFYATLLSKGRRKEVEGRYDEIGGGSPILRETSLQAAALRKSLREAGRSEPVKIVFRNSAPRAAGVLRSLKALGVLRVLPVTLYPHDCKATTGSSLMELEREARTLGMELLPGVLHYATDPDYLDSLARPLEAALREVPGATVVFSAHSLPLKQIEKGDPYQREIIATVEALKARVGAIPGGYELAYQSKVGPIRWLEPELGSVLKRLKGRDLIVLPVSFVTEHIETLHELDILFREVALTAGVRSYRRLPAPGADPAYIRCLAGRTLAALAAN
jgi:protoporphyrin/coproporphyrin ferrochelatase